MAELFCRSLLEYRSSKKFLLHAFVLMPNHIHLLLTVPEDLTLERTVQFIKGGFSREAGRVLRLSHPFWQKSFLDRRVRDADELSAFRHYILNNPVKAGLVNAAGEYRYSSANPEYIMDEVPQRLKAGTTGGG
jgi:putative transposase